MWRGLRVDSWKVVMTAGRPEMDGWELDQALKVTLELNEETEHWKV